MMQKKQKGLVRGPFACELLTFYAPLQLKEEVAALEFPTGNAALRHGIGEFIHGNAEYDAPGRGRGKC